MENCNRPKIINKRKNISTIKYAETSLCEKLWNFEFHKKFRLINLGIVCLTPIEFEKLLIKIKNSPYKPSDLKSIPIPNETFNLALSYMNKSKVVS